MKRKLYIETCTILALGVALLSGCNKSDSEPAAEPEQVSTLDLTVTGNSVQCPAGNVYLFYSEEANLSYASDEGDGSINPLIDITTQYSPVVKYRLDGQLKTLHPVSSYGSMSGGNLDTSSSVRYSQIHFNIASLSKDYGTVGKNGVVLVVIVLNDPQSKAWMYRPVQLRRDYLIHVYMPDCDKQACVTNEMSSKWWQVEGEDS